MSANELIETGDLLKVIEPETITGVFAMGDIVEVLSLSDGEVLTYQCENKKGRIGWLSIDEVEIYRTNGRDWFAEKTVKIKYNGEVSDFLIKAAGKIK